MMFSPLGHASDRLAAPVDLETTKSVLTRLIEEAIEEKGVPSISIALVKDDSIVWREAFGYANFRTKTPASVDTVYCLASTFKSVTSAALVQLSEQGKLNLDAPVNHYLGATPVRDRLQSEKPVTTSHLLSHWSGLTSFPQRGETTMRSVWSGEMPRSFREMAPQIYSIRAPEERYEYNNYGYAVAGLLLERISGKSYEEYVVENIWSPLGIPTKNPIHPSAEMAEMMAMPYEPPQSKGAPPRPAVWMHTEATPAGVSYGTPADMAVFLGALLNGGVFNGGRILSETSVAQLRKARFGGHYGLGLNVLKTAKGNTLIRHTGRMPGMSSVMLGDVDARVGVYYCANATDVPLHIADAAVALLRGESYPPAEREAIALHPEALDRLVGSYRSNEAMFDIAREGSSLFIRKNNSSKKAEVFAETPTMFFIKDDSASIAFEEDNGEVARMMVYRANWSILIGKKITEQKRE